MTTTESAEQPDVTAPSRRTSVVFDNAGKQFGDVWAVRGIDLEISEGSITGLIGPSGCGKTTTVRLATGAYRPDQGSVQLFGTPPDQLQGADRMTIGYLPQEPVLTEDLSIWENLNFLASLNGVKLRRRKMLHRLLDLVNLDDDRKKLVRESSGGMKRRLALAATLTNEAPILVLDEPTAGIDPILRRKFWDHFRELRDSGRTLIVATQYVGEAVDCDQVVLLAGGRVAASGDPDALRRQAFGGDIIEIETDRSMGSDLLAELRQVSGTHSVSSASPVRVRMVVDDGGATMPDALAVVERSDYRVVDSEEVIGDYDDVFVSLVGAHENKTEGVPNEPANQADARQARTGRSETDDESEPA